MLLDFFLFATSLSRVELFVSRKFSSELLFSELIDEIPLELFHHISSAGGGTAGSRRVTSRFRRGLLVSRTSYYFTNSVGYFAQVSI